ncbi:integrase core domain-containing protein, partial [Corynebacterium tuberculostearicum]|uniref:integrase core domain-containing protein n=1 Tax=Corynebacterium tuberculostearicum TaxID=38304 RepID=UPI0029348A6D
FFSIASILALSAGSRLATVVILAYLLMRDRFPHTNHQTLSIVCAEETTGLIHHSDHGSQYVSVVYNERLAQHGIAASTGTVGDSYDNALAENVNGSYKNELIHTRRWNDVVEVEIATFEWVSWWNETRLHQSLGYRTPVEVETEFWKQNPPQVKIEIKANA